MTDYISRDEILEVLEYCDFIIDRRIENGAKLLFQDSLEQEIKSLDAADVRPVVRGEWKTAWLDHEAFGERQRVFYCSACNQIITFRTLFCPNCGADMRKKEEELDER